MVLASEIVAQVNNLNPRPHVIQVTQKARSHNGSLTVKAIPSKLMELLRFFNRHQDNDPSFLSTSEIYVGMESLIVVVDA
jgi:hypothetical protein